MRDRLFEPAVSARRGPSGVLVATLLFATVLGACGGGDAPAEAPAATPTPSQEVGVAVGLEVREPVLQWVPGSTMASVYLEVVNPGSEADRLVRVETTSAAAAETHETLVEDDMVRMEARPDGFEIPAAGSLRLEPGGKHIMLIEPDAPPEGQGLVVTLHFERAPTVDVELEVSTDTGMDHSGMDHSGMDHGAMDHGTSEENTGEGSEDAADSHGSDSHGTDSHGTDSGGGQL